MSTQTKVKWTYTPGKKITVSKGYQWVRGQKVKAGIKLYPQVPMPYAIHNPHGLPVSRDMYSTDSKR